MAKTQRLEGVALAAAKAEEGKLAEAISLFRQAIRQGQQPAAVHESLAQCLNEVGDYEDARLAASKATELEPEVCAANSFECRCLVIVQGVSKTCIQLLTDQICPHTLKGKYVSCSGARDG